MLALRGYSTVPYSSMKTADQRGLMNTLAIPMILLGLFFIGAIVFGYWAFTGRQDYKNNTNQKVSAAVAEAMQVQKAEDKKVYDEAEKNPLDSFIGSAAYGNITVKYPKTWSAYVEQADTGSTPLDAFFNPGFVPEKDDSESTFALRVQLVQQSYDSVLNSFSGAVNNKQVTVAAYKLDKVPSVVGAKIDGQIKTNKQGTMIILPIRNLTLEVWTESNAFKADLDAIILKNLSFIP